MVASISHDARATKSLVQCVMDPRAPLGGGAQQRPRPQRAVSGGGYGSALPKRPTLPSRLSSVRSVTQPVGVVDLTDDEVKTERRNELAFFGNKGNVVLSPDVINIEDDEDEPPAKRLKTSGHSVKSDRDDEVGDGADRAHELVPGSPLPNLPKSKPAVQRISGTRRHRLGIEPLSRKAHGLDPPAVATRAPLPSRNALDFSPWTGKPNTHAEDTLNDTVIKAGYYDKAQGVNHNESNSAKASIWPNLSQKNNSGLSLLAYLFSAVMDRRQAIGRCTAPPTFKPPPRVTVTDTKREAWLRDLANPEVPLRKQSRTIPHGIRGKLLMEQCLSKNIPLPRAIWLAKCVGANELRAFRRKGVSGSAAASGEAKWVREWTVSVEQFLESIIDQCGEQEKGWQKSANYAVKLVTAIYVEKLLDMGHFLDWITSSLADATLERLPMWLALVQVFWKGITGHSRRGRTLARTILEHLHHVTETKNDANSSLKIRLQKLIVVLAVSNRGCLILPQVWEKYKYLLSPKEGSTDTQNTPAKNIAKRNERLAAPLYKSAANTRTPVMDLYEILDSIGTDFDRQTLVERCFGVLPDAANLTAALLDWASTPYRYGIARVYRASAIIAQLYHGGHDTDAAVLQYLSNANEIRDDIAHNINKVIVDLVRLEAFSVGRYLQWLITSGGFSAQEGSTPATALLAALPTAGLPLHQLNTRKTLIRRFGYELDEQAAVNDVLSRIDAALFEDVSWHFDPAVLPDNLTETAKLGVSQFVCNKTLTTAKDFGLSIASYLLARDVFEWIGDFPSLASLVSVASMSTDGVLLATACDTVNLNAQIFAALGQFKPIVEALAEQYIALRSQQPAERAFIHALTSLAHRVPAKASLMKLLRDDLAISEQQNSLAVCSPASDSVIGMHATSLDSDNDIDAVFASGNTMDEQLMQRVFTRIMLRAAKPLPAGPETTSRVVGWLNQLRSIDTGTGVFDKLVQNYLQAQFKNPSQASISASTVANLAVSESLSLNQIAELSKDANSPQLADFMLRMFISNGDSEFGLNKCEQYRFRLQRDQCQAEHPEPLITLVRTACDMSEFAAEDPDLIHFMIRCVSSKPGSVSRVFEHGGDHSHVLRTNASRIITRILQLGQSTADSTIPNKEFDMKALVGMANAFSVHYCLEAMRYVQSKASWSPEDESMLENAVLESFADRSDVWAQLLEFAGGKTNATIHAWAQDQLLYMAAGKSDLVDDAAHKHLRRCLELLAVTSRAANRGEDVTAVGTIAEKLKEIEAKLSPYNEMDSDFQSGSAAVLGQLQIMLHLSVMHIHSIPNESDSSRHARTNFLGTLCSLLVHPKLQLHQEIVEYLFDLCSTLSDSLADSTDGTVKLPAGLKLPQDPRLDFILDQDADTTETWLSLAYQERSQGTQQQRALAKHPSQQAHSRVPSSSQQQSPTQPQHQRWPSSSSQPHPMRQDSRIMPEIKIMPYQLRRWEVFSDPTPVMGENDGSLSLGLFGARKV